MSSGGGGIVMGEGFRLVSDGYMDRLLVGGLDLNTDLNVISGMDAFGAVCSKYNSEPEKAMRPFDQDRAGTVITDGGAMFLFETVESAIARGAKVYGEVAGFGMTCDAFHVLRPTDSGIGMISAIQQALIMAKVTPDMIDLFNCHATSTQVGDLSEAKCIASLLKAH